MPLYTFTNTVTGETRDVFFGMNDVKIYRGEKDDCEYVDEQGNDLFVNLCWQRVYHAPNTVIDGNINPFSQQDFLNKTKNAKTYGEMWDLSAEMSQQRADKLGGEDPMRKAAEKKFYKQK